MRGLVRFVTGAFYCREANLGIVVETASGMINKPAGTDCKRGWTPGAEQDK